MHGLGNDMIVIDSLGGGFVPTPGQARFLCDRRRGVGADQILVLLPSNKADFIMRIFNADGSEVEMCGNGIRCLALYIRDRGLSAKNPLAIETLAGIIRPEIVGKLVRVDMGKPVFDPAKVPVKIRGQRKVKDTVLRVDDDTFRMSAVSMGNPHCVIPVDDVDAVPLSTIGPRIEHHPWFPKRTNVEFVEAISRTRLKVRVWERGAGATLACGTGACAAAVGMMDLGKAGRKVTATLPGGDLEIRWDRKTNHVWMTGPAVEVFNGSINLKEK
ncbi:MAG TPA: diaminopimelate epimerase [bacterium]|nr:diaminopimelate epimerase [bacterium]